jgi:hypothetical protein
MVPIGVATFETTHSDPAGSQAISQYFQVGQVQWASYYGKEIQVHKATTIR